MRLPVATFTSLASFVALAAPAAAQTTIYAGPPNQYFNGNVSIDQGEQVTFQNLDLVDHDVVAQMKGPDSQPLFKSELIARGASTEVKGTEFLTTGEYEYFCSVHPNMKGSLEVTSAGQPKPRPGSGGGGGQSEPPPSSPPPPQSGGGPPADTTKPSVKLRIQDSRLGAVRKRRAVRVRVESDEPVTIGITVRSGKRTLGGTTRRVGAGTYTVTVKLKRFARSLSVIANAADAAGNASTARSSRRLG